jgi:hypothetical protein
MRYEVTTKLTPQDVLHHAITHFGSQGVGLDLTHQGEDSLIFQGGGGHVAVMACPGASSNRKTIVELETREWDYAVRQFMSKVH